MSATAASATVPFSRVTAVGDESAYLAAAVERGSLGGGGPDGDWCADWLRARTGANAAFPTPSCTAALELSALACGSIGPGDEVLMPSFTFVSTANAAVLRGATPVWVDVDPRTLSLDPAALEAAVTLRSRAVIVVHYGGVAADMDRIMATAGRHGLVVIEDAAHALLASWRGRALGSIAPLGCLSFDAQKNLTCGEGGAVLVNDPALVDAVEIARAKGTNRGELMRGETSTYEWLEPGSAWELGGLAAAFLRGQLEHAQAVTSRRLEVWERYHAALAPLARAGVVARPHLPSGAEHNGHVYWLMLSDRAARDRFIAGTRARGVATPFHYVPLHRSPAGREKGRSAGDLPATDRAGDCLVRLPLFTGMTDEQVEQVIESVLYVVGPAG